MEVEEVRKEREHRAARARVSLFFRWRLVSLSPVISFSHSPAPPRLDKLSCRVIEMEKEQREKERM